MKKITILCGMALLGGALSASPILAEDVKTTEKTVTTTTTTTNSGTVSQFGPDAIVIKGSGSSAPVAYQYTKTTTYVDEAGKPIATTQIKSGVPVTIYYSKAGDQMVATKVVVKKTTVVPGDAEVEED
jgi:hypothetical protein